MKIKTMLEHQTKQEFEQNLAYQEWLHTFNPEPTTKELNLMQKSMIKPSNNVQFHPLQGA